MGAVCVSVPWITRCACARLHHITGERRRQVDGEYRHQDSQFSGTLMQANTAYRQVHVYNKGDPIKTMIGTTEQDKCLNKTCLSQSEMYEMYEMYETIDSKDDDGTQMSVNIAYGHSSPAKMSVNIAYGHGSPAKRSIMPVAYDLLTAQHRETNSDEGEHCYEHVL